MIEPVVTLEPCGKNFRHSKRAWFIVLPLERLSSWTAFYRRLRDRNRGQYRAHYEADVAALSRFARDLPKQQKHEVEA